MQQDDVTGKPTGLIIEFFLMGIYDSMLLASLFFCRVSRIGNVDRMTSPRSGWMLHGDLK